MAGTVLLSNVLVVPTYTKAYVPYAILGILSFGFYLPSMIIAGLTELWSKTPVGKAFIHFSTPSSKDMIINCAVQSEKEVTQSLILHVLSRS